MGQATFNEIIEVGYGQLHVMCEVPEDLIPNLFFYVRQHAGTSPDDVLNLAHRMILDFSEEGVRNVSVKVSSPTLTGTRKRRGKPRKSGPDEREATLNIPDPAWVATAAILGLAALFGAGHTIIKSFGKKEHEVVKLGNIHVHRPVKRR